MLFLSRITLSVTVARLIVARFGRTPPKQIDPNLLQSITA
jgi:hypothetical protein